MRLAIPAALALAFASASCTPPQQHEAAVDADVPAAAEEPETAAVVEPERPARASRRRASSDEAGGYQYIDETGRVRIAASLEEVPERQRSTATALLNASRGKRRRDPSDADEPLGAAQRADVTIYTTPGCGWCRRAMAYFDQKGVDYTNRDISSDREAYDEFLNITGGDRGVPVIVVGEDWMQG